MDGYEKEWIDVIRYIDDDMVIIKDVEVFVHRKSEDDSEFIDMIIPDYSKDYINEELIKFENGYLISEYCIEESVEAYS